MIAPDADFAFCVGVITLQVLHLALPHGRVSPSGSSSRVSGLGLARTLGSSVGHDRSFCEDRVQSDRGINDGSEFVDYSRTSIARTPMARLPWLIQTRFRVPTKFFR